MVRECVASLLLLPAASCSLVLDFSDNAIPKDAAQEPARAFLTFLASPSSKARFKAYGLE